MAVAAAVVERRRVAVRGVVQGVGFRPFIYRLAREEALGGWVRNSGGDVEVAIEGEPASIDRFMRRLRAEAPPLSRIEAIEAVRDPPRGERAFAILTSQPGDRARPVSADAATCAACLAEILDPTNRRHRYPFTNCTGCGPRFTVIEALPYDRERTTLRGFPLCHACGSEYADPADRRFHAEPVACPDCGPRLRFLRRWSIDGADPRDPIDAAAAALRAGDIVALKGLGGYQLACDARSDRAVTRLRARKVREAKPFAIMVRDLDAARALARIDDGAAALLASSRAPIVLLDRHEDALIAAGVAPGIGTLGIVLPYTPLHHLLLGSFGGPLVMTSGNRSDEPIATDDDDAQRRLDGIADAFLLHDRPIAARYDDSVVRILAGREVVLRRARGYAPEPLRIAAAAPVPLLAVGGHLKSAFCFVQGRDAFLSQHIGDLEDAATLAAYLEAEAGYRRLFGIEPRAVVHDLHPDYATTRIAAGFDGIVRFGVQHHHAHVAACLAEHGVHEPALGVAFDGTGYGADGAAWGGELLEVDGAVFERTGHLRYLALPGGDAAAHETARMALSALDDAFGDDANEIAHRVLPRVDARRRDALLSMVRTGSNAPPTSSIGRLFDAVAALTGVADANRFEGQAAMRLEAVAGTADFGEYSLPFDRVLGTWDPAPLIRAVVQDVLNGGGASRIAARFHDGLAEAVVDACRHRRATTGIGLVVLTGGCFQNRRLAGATLARLSRNGFRVLTHGRVPPNDGGLAFGQAVVAIALLRAGVG